MSGTFKITVSELREIIRELVSESIIEEKFGEKIGNQYAGPGVADERNDECSYGVEEAAPKGYEKIVKGIKKSGTAKNPWAVANAMKKKGIKPKKK